MHCNVNVIDINVQNITSESDSREEDDLGRREAEVVSFYVAFEGVDGWR